MISAAQSMKTIELGDARNTRRWVIQSPPAEAREKEAFGKVLRSQNL